MLVEAHAVEAQLVHQAPSFEVFLVVAHRQFRLEVLLGQRVGKLAILLQVVQLLGVRQEVKAENLHPKASHALCCA